MDRKRELARYLHTLRQRLTRLAVLAEWAPVQRRARISILCGDMLGQLEQHVDYVALDGALRQVKRVVGQGRGCLVTSLWAVT